MEQRWKLVHALDNMFGDDVYDNERTLVYCSLAMHFRL
jgi:hypothetical protein